MIGVPCWIHQGDGADVLDVGVVVVAVLRNGTAGRPWCWLAGGGAPDHDAQQDAETRIDAIIAAERYLLERGLVTGHDLVQMAVSERRRGNR